MGTAPITSQLGVPSTYEVTINPTLPKWAQIGYIYIVPATKWSKYAIEIAPPPKSAKIFHSYGA